MSKEIEEALEDYGFSKPIAATGVGEERFYRSKEGIYKVFSFISEDNEVTYFGIRPNKVEMDIACGDDVDYFVNTKY